MFSPLGFDSGVFFQHLRLRRHQDAIETPQNGERQDDFAILVPLVGAAEQVADAPDEAGDLRVAFSGHGLKAIQLRQ
jgi:hypothetical protein